MEGNPQKVKTCLFSYNLSVSPHVVTQKSKLLLVQHTVQLQYSPTIIFSILRHLRDICKTRLLPSSQPGDIKQNQHGSDDRASQPPYSCDAFGTTRNPGS